LNEDKSNPLSRQYDDNDDDDDDNVNVDSSLFLSHIVDVDVDGDVEANNADETIEGNRFVLM